MIKLNWQILLLLGLAALVGAGYGFYYGYLLKLSGESLDKYWVMALAFAWVGSDLIKKAFKKRPKTSD